MAEAIALDGHEVVGIDKSSKAIAIARARVQLPNAKFIQADATNLPFEECSFAAAVCYLSLHHFRDPFPVLDEVLRVLRAGGTFYHRGISRPLTKAALCNRCLQYQVSSASNGRFFDKQLACRDI